MNTEKLLQEVENITLYIGTYGKKRCTCSCIGCTQDRCGNSDNIFQGNINQIKTIIERLPSLRKAYILGNPDISVDTKFCNLAAKEFIKHNIKVMFSTSGYNGLEIVKKLVENIETKYIEYISYSIDTIDERKFKYLKGTENISIKEIDNAIKYCNEKNITVKIQPTLWNINKNDYKSIIKHYEELGIKWYTFHIGSFEALTDKKIELSHIQPQECKEIVEKIKKISKGEKLKVQIPRIFLTKEEHNKYKNTYKSYCQYGGKGLQIHLQDDGIKATFCPLLSKVNPTFMFDIEKEKPILLKNKNNNCVVGEKCIDDKLKNISTNNKGKEFIIGNSEFYNICRFYSFQRNY